MFVITHQPRWVPSLRKQRAVHVCPSRFPRRMCWTNHPLRQLSCPMASVIIYSTSLNHIANGLLNYICVWRNIGRFSHSPGHQAGYHVPNNTIPNRRCRSERLPVQYARKYILSAMQTTNIWLVRFVRTYSILVNHLSSQLQSKSILQSKSVHARNATYIMQ